MTNTQTQLLTTLITTAHNAMSEAEAGRLFASHAGRALLNAAFELFECDDLYRLREDVEHEIASINQHGRKAA